MPRMRWRPELCPGPRWGSSRRSPRPHSQLGRGTPLDPRGVSSSLMTSILALSALAARRLFSRIYGIPCTIHNIFIAIHHWEQSRRLAKAGPARI